MFPLLAIAAGVTLTATIVRCVFDELSEEERRKQARIKKKQAEAEANYRDYLSRLDEYKKNSLDALSEEEKNSAKRMMDESNKAVRSHLDSYITDLIESARSQLAEKESLLIEINETILSLKDSLKTQTTLLRRNSLRALLRELEEAKEKTSTYVKVYLPRYIKNLERIKGSNIFDIPATFSFTLPENYFYSGKLMYMTKEELLTGDSIKINDYESLKFKFIEEEFIDGLPVDSIIPVMCDQYIGYPENTRILSARKGYFKNVVTSNPKIGISATVTGYSHRKEILLDYNDCLELKLPKKNLANENRLPPIGATIRVYPTNWTHNLYFPVEVSEKTSDSYLSFSFDDLPIVFSHKQWNDFKAKLDEKNLLSSTGEWKIAPLDESKIFNLEDVKFQLDNELCFSAKIIANDNNAYFSYNGILDEKFLVKPDDVFLGIDCVLNIYLDSDMNSIDTIARNNMTNLVLMTLSEFKVQYQTKNSRYGMQYFNKWAETTDKLITYLHKGLHTEIGIDKIEKEYGNHEDIAYYKIFVADPEELKIFVDKIYEGSKKARFVEFFFEFAPGIQSYVSIKGDASVLYASGTPSLFDDFFKTKKIITLYQKSFPYAETQQISALHQFRSGRLANPLLQAYALDASNIQSSRISTPIKLFNKNVKEDPSQLEAVEDAISEQDIFLIQGPPGTGKTTVIREIILQMLHSNPLTKILVVSQANVAVDNVLKGLLDIDTLNIDFIRCGQLDKIDSKIEACSFERIYEDYTDLIEKKFKESPHNPLYEAWYNIVCSDNQYNPNIGELILKSKSIIGATCVGLAQKKIGLNRVTYDLVIIDEAGKALPAEILIPYIRGKKVILIGDHMQLPPTVHPALLDPEKIEIDDRNLYEDELFNSSFFYRLFTAAPDSNKKMLSTQYRMPAVIGSLVSTLFYNSALKNGYGTDLKKPLFFPNNLTLINTEDPSFAEVSEQGKSVTNPGEAALVVNLLCDIRKNIPDVRIAVITPYKGQKRVIMRQLASVSEDINLQGIDINTVDAFQGDEAEIVIFCCTRTRRKTNFFQDPRRINVAFSRAKNELIIIGSLKYFASYDDTSVLPKVAEYIKRDGLIINPTIKKLESNIEHLLTLEIPLSSIHVDDKFRSTQPNTEKITALLDYHLANGKLDKPIVVKKEGDKYVLIDKYLRLYVAELLGLNKIEAIIKA